MEENITENNVVGDSSDEIKALSAKVTTKQEDVKRLTDLVSDLKGKIDDLVSREMNAIPQSIEYDLMSKELEKQKQELADLKEKFAELNK